MLSLLSEKEQKIVTKASRILENLAKYNSYSFTSPQLTRDYCRMQLRDKANEQFLCLFLDSQYRLIASEILFTGTVNAASVYPRVVVQKALEHNAAAIIFAHNHPSGIADASNADIEITKRLKSALALIDVSVLDHIIIGELTVSLAERGLI